MAGGKGIAINIGLNRIGLHHYGGDWDGQLVACEADARAMNALAIAQGYEATMLLTSDATADAVKNAISAASRQLDAGDVLFLSYSGHGGQVPDLHRDEADAQDETWLLYDRQLIDDELYSLWAEFKPGVRIFVLSDSCHSGSVTRRGVVRAIIQDASLTGKFAMEHTGRFRSVPATVGQQVYRQNRAQYDQIQRSHPSGDKVNVQATVLLISGCQDNQFSEDGNKHGLFTATLLRVWHDGHFRGGYSQFHKKISEMMPPWQSPNFTLVGAPNPEFVAQTPFKI